MLKKPQNVYLPIDKFQAKVFKNSDLSKRGEWVSNFALSLAGESKDEFAEELLTEAQVSFYKEKVRKWKNYIKNIICNENECVVPTENEIYTRCCEEYGDEFVEAVELVESNLKKNKKTKKTTAGAPNGNNGDESATACGNNKGRSPAVEGSARFPGSAGERPKNLGSGKPVSTPTISTSGPRQAGNAAAEATAPSSGGSAARISTDGDTRKDSHGHASAGNSVMAESGGTSVDQSYAQALDSLSDKASDQAASNTGNAQPVACRESGKFKHDKRKYGDGNTADTASGRGPEPDKFEVTTKKPNGVCADAGNGNAPEDCKSATSAQPLRPWKEVVEKSLGMTGNDKRPAGGSTPSSSSLVPPAGTVDVLSLAYSGEFQNVLLTQEQYAELGIRFGNQQKLNRAIDSLSCKLENEEIKPVPKNHYALLLKWASYREDMEEKKELEESKPKMTNMEKTWIAAMKRVEAM